MRPWILAPALKVDRWRNWWWDRSRWRDRWVIVMPALAAAQVLHRCWQGQWAQVTSTWADEHSLQTRPSVTNHGDVSCFKSAVPEENTIPPCILQVCFGRLYGSQSGFSGTWDLSSSLSAPEQWIYILLPPTGRWWQQIPRRVPKGWVSISTVTAKQVRSFIKQQGCRAREVG